MALQFHHRDPTAKEFRLGSFNGSLQRLLREAEKCDLVCANCHRRRHAHRSNDAARIVELRRQQKARAVLHRGGACVGCGGVFEAAVFDFHHVDPAQKEYAISGDGVYRSWDRVVVELGKCVLLCANCHAEVHAGLRELDPPLAAAAD